MGLHERLEQALRRRWLLEVAVELGEPDEGGGIVAVEVEGEAVEHHGVVGPALFGEIFQGTDPPARPAQVKLHLGGHPNGLARGLGAAQHMELHDSRVGAFEIRPRHVHLRADGLAGVDQLLDLQVRVPLCR